MHIQNYQIHNVLNVYRRQLSQAKPDPVRQSGNVDSEQDSVRISTQGKNQSIMEKVADNVIKKITTLDPKSGFKHELNIQIAAREQDHLHRDAKSQDFVFNSIGGDNQKTTRSIAVDDTQGLMNQLNQLAQAAVNRKAE